MYHKNSMATASLIFGILAILSGSVFIIAIGLGALSVLCALLSKTDRHLSAKSLAGMLAGIIAAVSSCAMTAYSFYSIMNNPQARAYYSQVFSALLEAYGLPDSYNFFANGLGGAPNVQPEIVQDPATPAPNDDNDSHQSNEDYFDSLYDDYFRYFYGADPYHEETPVPAAPSAPSVDSSQGDFI